MPSVMSRSRERIGCWMEPNLSLDITSWDGGRREKCGRRKEGERREGGGGEKSGRKKGRVEERGRREKEEGGRRLKKQIKI